MFYKVFDNEYASRVYMVGDFDIQFRDHEAVVPAAAAYRMSRVGPQQEFLIEKKRVPFNPDSWKTDRRLIWSCNVSSANGYGMVAENTIRHLRAQGVNVECPGSVSGNTISGGEYVHPDVLPALKESIEPDCLEIQHCQPPAIRNDITERIWTYTMFETDHTPRSWIRLLNKVEHILVPSSWLVQSWQEQGVTRPISVYGHGIDPEVYSYIQRPQREVFTFLHWAQLSLRKGTDLVYHAFRDEFGDSPDVRLILKNTYPFFPVPLGAPNVEYIHATYSKQQMRELLARADVCVFPSRGEGFGLPPLEAMATGMAAIVTGWSGMADYIDPSDTMILPYTMSRAIEFDAIYKDFWEGNENAGNWAEPSYEELRGFMRWSFEHRDEVSAMGKRAATRIARDWTWEQQTSKLTALLDGLA